MMDIIQEHPEKTSELLRHFTRQVREMDDLALAQAQAQAFAPQSQCVGHALNRLWRSTGFYSRNPEIRIAKIGPQQIAKSAQV